MTSLASLEDSAPVAPPPRPAVPPGVRHLARQLGLAIDAYIAAEGNPDIGDVAVELLSDAMLAREQRLLDSMRQEGVPAVDDDGRLYVAFYGCVTGSLPTCLQAMTVLPCPRASSLPGWGHASERRGGGPMSTALAPCPDAVRGPADVPEDLVAAALRFGEILDRRVAWDGRRRRLRELLRRGEEDPAALSRARDNRGDLYVVREAEDVADRAVLRLDDGLSRAERRLRRLFRHYGVGGVAAGGRVYLDAPDALLQDPAESGAWLVYVWPMAGIAGLGPAG